MFMTFSDVGLFTVSDSSVVGTLSLSITVPNPFKMNANTVDTKHIHMVMVKKVVEFALKDNKLLTDEPIWKMNMKMAVI